MNLEKNTLFIYRDSSLIFFQVLTKDQNRSSIERAHIYYFTYGLENVRNDNAGKYISYSTSSSLINIINGKQTSLVMS